VLSYYITASTSQNLTHLMY